MRVAYPPKALAAQGLRNLAKPLSLGLLSLAMTAQMVMAEPQGTRLTLRAGTSPAAMQLGAGAGFKASGQALTPHSIGPALSELTVIADPAALRAAVGRNAALLGIDAARIAAQPLPRAEMSARPDTRPEFSEGSVGLALTRLAVMAGPTNFAVVKGARSGADDAIYLSGGTARLSDLAKAGIEGIAPVRGGVLLTRPLVVWNAAALSVEAGETLYLSRADGAFLLSFGQLDIHGGALVGTAEDNREEPRFAPFVAVAGQGMLRADAASFSGLGGLRGALDTDVTSGLSVSAGLLYRPEGPSRITGSRFHNMAAVFVDGIDNLVLAGNRFEGQTRSGLVLRNLGDATLTENTFTTYGSSAAAQISGAQRMEIARNTFLRSSGGMLVDGGSHDVELGGNILAATGQTGIEIRDAACIDLHDNLVLQSEATGLRLNHVASARLARNAMAGSGSAGLELRAMNAGNVELRQNLIALNREGIRGDQPAALRMKDNRIREQFPRLMGGPVAEQQAAWLAAQKAGTELNVSASHAAQTYDLTCKGI